MDIILIMVQSQIITLITHTIIVLMESIWFCIIIIILIMMKYIFQPDNKLIQIAQHHNLQIFQMVTHHKIQPLIIKVQHLAVHQGLKIILD